MLVVQINLVLYTHVTKFICILFRPKRGATVEEIEPGKVKVTYQKPGDYEFRVSVKDDHGLKHTAPFKVRVVEGRCTPE